MAASAIRVLQTVDHRCGYFSDRLSRNLVVDPMADNQSTIYDALTHSGFRRAGDLIFRPHCRQCSACLATRLPAVEFKLNRNHHRCLKGNQDLRVTQVNATYTDEYFDLYQRYLSLQHPGGGMDNPSKEEFDGFLLSSWAQAFFLESRDQAGNLVAVAVCDQLSSGLSAVYTFYDAAQTQRSLGTFCILQQIALVKRLMLPYLYLGYWIKDHPKMDYKRRFRPLEVFSNGCWKAVDEI